LFFEKEKTALFLSPNHFFFRNKGGIATTSQLGKILLRLSSFSFFSFSPPSASYAYSEKKISSNIGLPFFFFIAHARIRNSTSPPPFFPPFLSATD